MRSLSRWLLACLAVLLHTAAWAGVTASWLREPAGGADVEQVRRLPAQAWAPLPAAALNAGYVSQPHWFRVRIEAPDGHDTPGYLTLDNPLLDEVSIHVTAGPQAGRRHDLGARRPFHERPVSSTALRVPLELRADAPTELLVRVSTSTALQLKFAFETQDQFLAAERGLLVINGVLFGVMLAMAAYNLCLLASTRDRTYVWYVGWVLCIGLFSAAVVGAAYEWLWPGLPGWNATSRPVMLSLAVAFAMAFARDFISVVRLDGRMAVAIGGLGVLAVAWAAGSLVMPYQLAIQGAIAIAVLAMVMAPLGAWLAWRRGSEAAGYYLLAFVFVVLGGFALAAEKVGLLPSSLLTQHASQIGAAVESVVLSFALAARLSAERQLRERAQLEAERSQAEAQRLVDLSLRDALTGLYNRRRLETRLEALSHDQRGAHDALTVMMVDIDHFKRLNDTHGHAAGDACIRAVARELQRHAHRDTDLAVRYGGEEFCLLLPGMEAAHAAAAAEALRAAIESLRIEHQGRLLQVTASIGVATSSAALPLAPATLLHLADEALYAAKAGGRNRWMCREPVAA